MKNIIIIMSLLFLFCSISKKEFLVQSLSEIEGWKAVLKIEDKDIKDTIAEGNGYRIIYKDR
jgi:hypothetical protein